MRRLLFTTLLTAGFTLPAAGQEPASPGNEDEPTATAEPEADDADLDEESYLDAEDDDFTPSEDIPADQSIAYPTDI